MFLKLNQIAQKLDQIFLPLEQEGMTGMRLLLQNDVKATTQALKNAQEALGVNFPAKFTKLLSKIDLGDYASELVRLNSVDEYGGKWWQGEARPLDLIVFAVGDP